MFFKVKTFPEKLFQVVIFYELTKERIVKMLLRRNRKLHSETGASTQLSSAGRRSLNTSSASDAKKGRVSPLHSSTLRKSVFPSTPVCQACLNQSQMMLLLTASCRNRLEAWSWGFLCCAKSIKMPRFNGVHNSKAPF